MPYIEEHNQNFSNSQMFIPVSGNDYSSLQNLHFDQQRNLSSSKTDGDLSHLSVQGSLPSTSEGRIKFLNS